MKAGALSLSTQVTESKLHQMKIGDFYRPLKKPVTLPFTLAISGDTARMSGAIVLNRTAFGVGQGQWTTGEVVDTKVTVNVALTAHRAH